MIQKAAIDMVFRKIMVMKASKVAKLVLSPHWGLLAAGGCRR